MSEYEKALVFNRSIRDALQLVLEELNQGQRQKLMKNEKVHELLERYGIDDHE